MRALVRSGTYVRLWGLVCTVASVYPKVVQWGCAHTGTCLGPFVLVKRNLNAIVDKVILDNFPLLGKTHI